MVWRLVFLHFGQPFCLPDLQIFVFEFLPGGLAGLLAGLLAGNYIVRVAAYRTGFQLTGTGRELEPVVNQMRTFEQL